MRLTSADLERDARAAGRIPVRQVDALRCLLWVQRAWQDMLRCPVIGVLHGLFLGVIGAVIVAVAHERFWLLVGAFSGFLLIAPVLATGLYAISRDLEAGRGTRVQAVLDAWRPRDIRMVTFGLLLALAGTGWMLTSAALITAFAPQPINGPADFLRYVVLAPNSWLFEAWLMLGGFLAAPVFASSVIAMPFLLDRQVSVMTAVLTSWRAVMLNTTALSIWAAFIMVVTTLGLATLFLGLAFTIPLVGHASWHAYRDLVPDPAAILTE